MGTKQIYVLQIEDNPDDAFLITTMIQDQEKEHEQRQPITVINAASLTEGLDVVEREAIDIVLLDLGLPESSGIGTLELFRQKAPGVPVIILTGLDDESFALNAVQTGADDYLVKGNISPETLTRAIRYAYGRNTAAIALTESEQRFSAVIQSASDAVLIIDGEGKVVSCNRSAEKMFGYSDSKLVGQPFQMIIPEAYRMGHADGLQRLLHGGTLHKIGRTVEMHALRQDQSEFPIELSLTTWQLKDDQFFSAFIHDISERKESEKALAESQRQLSTLLDNLPGMAYRRKNDAEWTMELVSNGCLALTGHPPESLINNAKISYRELIDPQDLPQMSEVLHEQLQANQVFHLTYRIKTAADIEKWVLEQGRGVPSENGQGLAVEGFITDITDRVLAEEEVLQGKEHYQSLFEGVPVGLYRTSRDGEILDINRTLIEMVGFPDRKTAMSYLATSGYVDPADRTIWQERMDRAGVVEHFETRWRRQDGGIIWVEESARVIRDPSGQALYYEGSATDITARKQTELALKQSEEKYRVLFENMLDGFALHEIVLDDAGRPVDYIYLDANHAFEEMTGLRVADILSRPVTEVLPGIENDLADWIGKYGEVALAGTELRFEMYSEVLEKWYAIVAFSPRKGQFATIFQDITARKKAEEEQQASMQREQSLHEISKALTGTLDLEQVLTLILANLTRIVRCDTVSVQLVEGDRSEIVACHGFERPDEVVGHSFAIGEEFPNYAVIKDGKAYAYDDIEEAFPCFQQNNPSSVRRIHAWLGVPLIIDQKVIGMLTLDRFEAIPFLPDVIEITTRFAAQAAVALNNAQLYKILTESEASFHDIFEGVQDAILVEALDGAILDANARACELYGRSRESLLSMNAAELVPEEALLVLLDQNVDPEQSVSTFETTNLHSDGTPIPVEITFRRSEIAGVPVQLVVVRDITDRKRAESEIQQKINRLEALRMIDMAIVGLTDLDSSLRIFLEQLMRELKVDAACILLRNEENGRLEFASSIGFRTNALQYTSLAIGEGYAGRAAQDMRPMFIDDLETQGAHFSTSAEFESEGFKAYYAIPLFIRGEVFGVIEIFHRSGLDPNQDWVQFLDMLVTQASIAIDNATLFTRLQDQNASLAVAVADATQELRQSHRRLEVILNNSPDTILLVTTDGLIESANDSIEPMFKYEPREVEGQRIDALIASNTEQKAGDPVEDVLRSSAPRSWESNAARKDGTSFEAEIVFAPIRVNMIVTAFVCTIRDITAWKELDRMKDGFVSNVSHELRTPITSLRLNHSLLTKDPENVGKYLDRFDREIGRLTLLIEDLLRLSRLDQGQIKLNPEVVDLAHLIESTIQDRVPMAEAKQLELVFVPGKDPPAVNADAGLIGQVLSILVTNAIHYTPAGGHVKVRQVQGDLGSFTWSGFSVEDDGPGISPEDLPHLFERFYRGKVGRDSGAPGTGLGLAIAQEIVHRHHGQLDVASPGIPGQGTVFTVKLPLNDNPGELEK